MGSGWKVAIILLLLAALAVIVRDTQRTAEEPEQVRRSNPRSTPPDSSGRPGRNRPDREREERPGKSGGATK